MISFYSSGFSAPAPAAVAEHQREHKMEEMPGNE